MLRENSLKLCPTSSWCSGLVEADNWSHEDI